MQTPSKKINSLVSVVIPALNEARFIQRCIRSVLLHFPRALELEILVGDHGSSDDTIALAEAAGAKTFMLSGGTVADLRNKLVDRCSGDFVVFLDADTYVTESWGMEIPGAIEDLSCDQLQITGSMCIPPESKEAYIEHWFAKLPRDKGNYLGTGHLITTRKLFAMIGGFSGNLRSGEDFDFCERALAAGAKIKIRDSMCVIHDDYPKSLASFVRREAWHGSGDFQSINSILKSKVALATLLFIAINFLVIFLILTHPLFAALTALSLILFLTACSFHKFRDLDFKSRLYNIMIFYLYLLGRSLSAISVIKIRRGKNEVSKAS